MATAVYLRVSSRSQRVKSQRHQIERYLEAQSVEDARWFEDNAISGSIMERPALDKLKRAIFLGEVDTVIVYALDRLARDAVEGMVLIADWLKRILHGFRLQRRESELRHRPWRMAVGARRCQPRRWAVVSAVLAARDRLRILGLQLRNRDTFDERNLLKRRFDLPIKRRLWNGMQWRRKSGRCLHRTPHGLSRALYGIRRRTCLQ